MGALTTDDRRARAIRLLYARTLELQLTLDELRELAERGYSRTFAALTLLLRAEVLRLRLEVFCDLHDRKPRLAERYARLIVGTSST